MRCCLRRNRSLNGGARRCLREDTGRSATTSTKTGGRTWRAIRAVSSVRGCSGAMAPAARSLPRPAPCGSSAHGGTMPSAVLPATGEPFLESLDTTRFDGGLVAQTPVRGRYVMTRQVLCDAEGRALPSRRRPRARHSGHVVRRAGGARDSATADVGRRRRVRTFDARSARPAAVRLRVQRSGRVRAGRHRGERWLTISASGRVDVHNAVRHVRQSADLRSAAARILDQRASRGERVLCAVSADRGNRGRRTRASVDPDGAQGGARTERVA